MTVTGRLKKSRPVALGHPLDEPENPGVRLFFLLIHQAEQGGHRDVVGDNSVENVLLCVSFEQAAERAVCKDEACS